MKIRIGIYVLVCIGLLGACKKSKSNNEVADTKGKDRAKVLSELTEHIILPSYAAFKGEFSVFVTATDSFANNPNTSNLVALKAAWENAYISWETVELFDFGPAENQTLRNFMNIYPADTNGIIANFSNPVANLETAASYAQQGFPALDYLLNGVGSTNADIVAFYTDAVNGNKRRNYLQRIATRMNTLVETVISSWNGTYKETFVSKTGLDISSSTSLMVNGFVMHYERFIRSGKFGIPSGVLLNGVPAPTKVEAYYKPDLSLILAKTAHQSYVDFFNGKSIITGEEIASIKSYINALGAKDGVTGKPLSEILNAQFDVCKTKMDALGNNLVNAIQTQNASVIEVYTEMQAATRMLKVDMTSAMSITITYTDNDGD